MYLNEAVVGIPLEGPLPDQEMLRRNRADGYYIPFEQARGELDLWFKRTVVPQLPSEIGRTLKDLSIRLDEWNFKEPMGKQGWHFDFPNSQKEWVPSSQGLLVLGGDAPTDVADPIDLRKFGDYRAAIRSLQASPESLSYRSYPPGTFIWSPRGLFVHRRGGLCNPCKRMGIELSQVFYD